MTKKSMTTVSDIVLVYLEDRPLAYARVEDIEPDVKQGWFRITLLVLQIPPPPAVVTWILRDSYIDGEEYSMGGRRMRLEKVVAPKLSGHDGQGPAPPPGPEEPASEKTDSPRKPKVISFADLKKSPRQP